ncbi:MAG: efflux RND transporter periplasmic adaptor subunit [Deltaproteobacteria bacterium]|nr:efflux RND transporter periplasmic adaptor subunit [Deltaproteobacteria bacterium]
MKTKGLVVFLLAFVLSSCARENKTSREGTPPKPVGGVAVEEIQPVAVEEFFDAVGTVKARRSAPLSSRVVGTILTVAVREGDRVRKGQRLVEIDSRDLRAGLDEAEASIEEMEWTLKAAESAVAAAEGQKDLALATFKRYESLIARGSVTPQEYDEAKARYEVADAEAVRAGRSLSALKAKREQAQAKLSHARTVLDYTNIVAPFDGLVTAKTAEVGMLASPGTALLTIEETGRYCLEAEIGESRLAYARIGTSVRVSIAALGREFSGTVAEITPAADPQSRTFTLKIDLPAHSDIRSGLYGKAEIPFAKRKILLVPLEAVLRRGQLVAVYVVDVGGVVQLRLITTGKRYNEKVEVLSGVIPGERIIMRGVEKISEGERVSAPQGSR